MQSIAKFLGSFRFLPGPIIAVEMVAIARRKWQFILRCLYVCALSIAVVSVYGDVLARQPVTRSSLASASANFFGSFGLIQLFAVLLVGPAIAAGTIAAERERRTIEYLFTSTLSNSEIILGKLFVRVLSILCILLAGVPVMSLAMLNGGISPEALLALWIITVSTTIFIAIVSVCISVFAKRARDAIIRSYLALIVLFAMVPAVTLILDFNSYHKPGGVLEFFYRTNPIITFVEFLDSTSRMRSGGAWEKIINLVINQAIVAGILLLFATFMIRRVHLRQAGVGTRKRFWRFRLISRPVGNDPMLWKELYCEPVARLGWVGSAALALIYLVVLAIVLINFQRNTYHNSYPYLINEQLGLTTAIATTVASCALLVVGARAACGIVSEKERECWETLTSTSLSARDIVMAKILGSASAIRLIAPLLVLVWLPMIFVRPLCLVVAAIQFVTIALIAVFASTLGTRVSLSAKSSMRAMAATVGMLAFFGGGYLLCAIALPIFFRSGPGDEAILGLAPCAPFLICITPILAMENNYGHDNYRVETYFTIAYIAGMVLYTIATVGIYKSTIDLFDRLSGRTTLRSFYGQPFSPTTPVVRAIPEEDSPSIDP